jgi:serine protease AprX
LTRPTTSLPDGLRWRRSGARATVVAATVAAVFAGAAASAQAKSVVVLEHAGAGNVPERTVASLGGTVERQLPLIDGFAADLPASAVAALRRSAGVRSVSPDRAFKLHDAGESGVAPGTSLAVARDTVRAGAVGAGGAGVDVAVIDSGVSPVPGLDAPGKIVNAPDLSPDARDAGKAHLDGFGHGTHLAGAIAGDDAASGFAGLAPSARIVNVKVADHNGQTSLAQILAGLDWIGRNGRRDGLNVRVVNIAFGSDAGGDFRSDPLALAVERVWQKGIVVVAAAGNGGPGSTALDSPAYDPFIVAVGAEDTAGTPDAADDFVAEFSSRGSASRAPDVVAPGVAIVSLRVPGALLDEQFPNARIGEGHFRGSGTSQAAAVASGALARLIAERPALSPDEAKAVIRATARPLADADASLQGVGLLDIAGAAVVPVPKNAAQRHTKAHGTGKFRGSLGIELAVEHPNASRWTASRWTASRWTASRWTASRWTASRWTASRWTASRWTASRWTASRWTGVRWTTADWNGEPTP